MHWFKYICVYHFRMTYSAEACYKFSRKVSSLNILQQCWRWQPAIHDNHNNAKLLLENWEAITVLCHDIQGKAV